MKIPYQIKSCLAFFALVGVLSAASLIEGCATWQDTSGRLLASTALTVDASMKGWAYHVVNDGVPDSQQVAVKAAYAKYQLAMSAASTAYSTAVLTKDQSIFTQASQALTASSSALTTMIASFQTPK